MQAGVRAWKSLRKQRFLILPCHGKVVGGFQALFLSGMSCQVQWATMGLNPKGMEQMESACATYAWNGALPTCSLHKSELPEFAKVLAHCAWPVVERFLHRLA